MFRSACDGVEGARVEVERDQIGVAAVPITSLLAAQDFDLQYSVFGDSANQAGCLLSKNNHSRDPRIT